MSKATPVTTRSSAPIPHAGNKQGTVPARRKPHAPARPAGTQDLIARIWETLEWRKTLQVAFIIAVTGITVTLMLAGLGLLAHAMTGHAMTGQAATWPVGASIITGVVSYRAARRRHQ